MEPNTNPITAPSSTGDVENGHGNDNELTKLPLDTPHCNEEDDDGVDFKNEQGSESNEAIDTENVSRSVDKNQSSETKDVVKEKDSQTAPDSLDEELEIVIKNQHKYYIYCPCCGEDITKTVKLVKKSDLQPAKNNENGSRSEDKKTKVPSWFPVYGQNKDKGKEEVDTKSPGSYIGEKPSIKVKTEKDGLSFPRWYLNVLLLCIIIVVSIFSTSPQQSPPFIPLHLELPSISSLWLRIPTLSPSILLLLLPTFAVLLLAIMAIRSRYSPRYQEEKGNKRVDSKSSDDQAADPDQYSVKKTDNQKVHPAPLDLSPQEQPSIQNTETETPSKTQPEMPNSIEPRKSGNKLEILKSIVYGGLTQSITSLCTVTSAAASGASTLNVLALGVANLSSGFLLIVHSLQELINEKPRRRTNTDNQKNSETGEEEDRYEEILGRREKSKLHRLIAISSFVICGLLPPLVYGFSFRRRIEKRQEYKTLAVYAVSLTCIVLLSLAKAYVSKSREYVKTLFKYTAMATTASGLSQFLGYLVSHWLEIYGFYDDHPETPRV